MKKRVSFLMIFLLALLLTGCSEKSGGSTQYQVYYISTSGTKLVEESYTPESSTSPVDQKMTSVRLSTKVKSR